MHAVLDCDPDEQAVQMARACSLATLCLPSQHAPVASWEVSYDKLPKKEQSGCSLHMVLYNTLTFPQRIKL